MIPSVRVHHVSLSPSSPSPWLGSCPGDGDRAPWRPAMARRPRSSERRAARSRAPTAQDVVVTNGAEPDVDRCRRRPGLRHGRRRHRWRAGLGWRGQRHCRRHSQPGQELVRAPRCRGRRLPGRAWRRPRGRERPVGVADRPGLRRGQDRGRRRRRRVRRLSGAPRPRRHRPRRGTTHWMWLQGIVAPDFEIKAATGETTCNARPDGAPPRAGGRQLARPGHRCLRGRHDVERVRALPVQPYQPVGQAPPFIGGDGPENCLHVRPVQVRVPGWRQLTCSTSQVQRQLIGPRCHRWRCR